MFSFLLNKKKTNGGQLFNQLFKRPISLCVKNDEWKRHALFFIFLMRPGHCVTSLLLSFNFKITHIEKCGGKIFTIDYFRRVSRNDTVQMECISNRKKKQLKWCDGRLFTRVFQARNKSAVWIDCQRGTREIIGPCDYERNARRCILLSEKRPINGESQDKEAGSGSLLARPWKRTRTSGWFGYSLIFPLYFRSIYRVPFASFRVLDEWEKNIFLLNYFQPKRCRLLVPRENDARNRQCKVSFNRSVYKKKRKVTRWKKTRWKKLRLAPGVLHQYFTFAQVPVSDRAKVNVYYLN